MSMLKFSVSNCLGLVQERLAAREAMEHPYFCKSLQCGMLFILSHFDDPLSLPSFQAACSLRHRQSNPLVYTVCVLVHDILILLSRKDIYSRF